jgi:hypothetical protein
MKFHLLKSGWFVLALLALPAGLAFAGGISVLEATGNVELCVFGVASPTPAFGSGWYHEPEDGTSFHDETTCEFPEEFICGGWLTHGDTDNLVFNGWWADFFATFGYTCNTASFTVDLSLLVEFPWDMQLTARRTVTGDLAMDRHHVNLVYPDASEVQLLGPDTQINDAEVALPAGTYRLNLEVYALAATWPGAYDATVEISWEKAGGVAVEQTAWGAVKALYRQ